ncbi:MAG: exopolysaccharide biosynthesis polyprenyl glycosylphosphotransferase [Ignavibacteriae bacterium]|nr:exopolysaccharide biosynthesis polyprenyl glycosylphosphotransferase [Ignavibacteriota bacterium]
MSLLFFLLAVMVTTVTWFVTPRIRALAIKKLIGDYPGERKIHTKFIPRLGGVGVITGFAIGLLVTFFLQRDVFESLPFQFTGLIGGLILIAIVGVYDDIKGIGSSGKLIIQILASVIVISSGLRIESLTLPFLGPIQLGWFSYVLTLLWLVGVTNAFNLLDGLDGLACGVAAIGSLVFFFMGAYYHDFFLMATTLALFFACLGFLRYNFHPASIFMGDTGSLFLGFLLACLGLRVIQHSTVAQTPVSFLVIIVALAVPIVDTSVAFFRRVRKRMHPLKADKEHIHHRLMDLGLTHRQTVVVHYAIATGLGVIAFVLMQVDGLYASLLLGAVIIAVYLSIGRLGYLEEMKAKHPEERPPIQPLSIARIIDRVLLASGDLFALLLSFLITYWLRFHSGIFVVESYAPLEMYFSSPTVLIFTLMWFIMFALAGLYDIPWDCSRIDYIFTIMKTIGWGTLLIFLATIDLESGTLEGRITTLLYGVTVAVCVVLVRMAIITFERKHEILGYRRRNTLIVGMSNLARELVQEIQSRPGLKYHVIGFVDRNPNVEQFASFPVLGSYDLIPELVKKRNVEEILIAATHDTREEILDVVSRCNGMVPTVKVMAEQVDILSGFKTEEIVGHPLIRLYMMNMKRWQWTAKRLIDIIVSLIILIPLLPAWLIIAIIIKLDSSGPVFFVQERVGKKGEKFNLIKFRSMVHEAEKETGPVWASPEDKRRTRLGRILRKLRLDEVPQFLNVLKGEMSLVGPRPERPFFVEQLKKEIRFYGRRLLVRPGITGWAQVNHRYDISFADVKEKIKYDLYYLENMSLTLDIKIFLRTILVALSGKGTH